jgi:hypothetical protein
MDKKVPIAVTRGETAQQAMGYQMQNTFLSPLSSYSSAPSKKLTTALSTENHISIAIKSTKQPYWLFIFNLSSIFFPLPTYQIPATP